MSDEPLLNDYLGVVLVPRDEYDRLLELEKSLKQPTALLPLSPGARASLAHKIVRQRVTAGLSQRELAQRAGVRRETVSRIESLRCLPRRTTLEKIHAALRAVVKSSARSKPRPSKDRPPKEPSVQQLIKTLGKIYGRTEQ